MISVDQAIQIISESIDSNSELLEVSVGSAMHNVLAEDVMSPINMPPFRQSAMDGYALNLHNKKEYLLIGEVKAGDNENPILEHGEAVRIFTGAPVPDTANAVIMQEKTSVVNSKLIIHSDVKLRDNIRPLGEQVQKGYLALKKGTKLNPAAIAYLSTLGITKVSIIKKPKITIVVTGNELAKAGQELQYGQIYESNAVMLKTALKHLGYIEISIHEIEDNYEKTLMLLNDVISKNDVVLISGGISVGDYDFVGKALNELKVDELFYKIKQKPGKPLYFGKKEEKIIFALPGNPAASLSCFYIYVLLALEKLSGNSDFQLNKIMAISKSDFVKKGERAQFLKAIYKNNEVEILDGQSSSMLHTFALSNALVYLSETEGSVKKNDKAEVILLPLN